MDGARKPVMHRRPGGSLSREKRPERYLMPGRGKGRSAVFDDNGQKRLAKPVKRTTLRERIAKRERKMRRFTETQRVVYRFALSALITHSMVFVVGIFLVVAANVAYILGTFKLSLWGLMRLLSWAIVLVVHYFITYALFEYYHIPTKDLDDYADYLKSRAWKIVTSPTEENIVPQLEDEDEDEDEAYDESIEDDAY